MFNSHLLTGIVEPFTFALLNKSMLEQSESSSSSQNGKTDIDDLLNELQCDYELDGDYLELKYDFQWYFENLIEEISKQVGKVVSKS